MKTHRCFFLFTAAISILFTALPPGCLSGQARPEPEKQRLVNALVLLGEWFGDAYFPLQKEMSARGWTQKRIGIEAEYRGCYNKARDVVLGSEILIPDLKDFSAYDCVIIPSGPQFRKFKENPVVLEFLKKAHAEGMLIASFCVGNFLVQAAGLLPEGAAVFPEKVIRVRDGLLLGPRGGGPPPGDGEKSAPIKELCDAIARELADKIGGGTFPVLKGPYLGQKPPGTTPEVFAPGVVSRDGIQMKLTMTADGSEILYSERAPATNAASFIIRNRAGNSWGEPVVLPYSRDYLDIEPSLSPDGKKILFVSNRPASGQGEPQKMPDIWLAEKSGDQWGNPVRLGPPVWTDDPADIEAHPAFLPDGGIYFMRQRGKTRRLFHAARNGDGFAEPVAVPLKEDLFAEQFSGPSLSPDGRILLMHSRKEGGFGNWDLYVAFRDGAGGWSELKNLGPAGNTDRPESSPTFSSDGRFIFFTRETDIHWVSAKVIEELKPKELK